MATIADSIKAQLDADWTGAGGVEPAYYVTEDYSYRMKTPEGKDHVWLTSKTLREDIDAVNETYSNVTRVFSFIVNSATTADRLKELSDEVERILNATAIAGVNWQKVTGRQIVTPEARGNHQEEITVTMLSFMVTSASAHGAGTTGDFAVVGDLTVGGDTELTGDFSFNTGEHVDVILDEDDMASDDAAALCTQQSIKKYVDDQILTEDTLAELNDTTIAGLADNHILTYDNGTSKWINEAMSSLNTQIESVITAEIVGGQSIDNAIDALIATHTADDNAHHEVVEAHADLSDTTLTGPYLEDLLMFGSANAAWFTVAPVANSDAGQFPDQTATRLIFPVGTHYLVCWLPQPTTRGSLKLYISGTRIGLEDADANNKIDARYVYGIVYDGRTALDTNLTDLTTQDLHTDTFTPVDCSSYELVAFEVGIIVGTEALIDISSIQVRCYYDI